jgi:hypothetical protein
MNTAIYSRLSGGTALTSLLSGGTATPCVFYMQAPDNITQPYVTWSFPSEIDQNLISHRMKDVVLRVQGYCTSPALAGTIDAQIDSLLNESELTMGTPWTNIWLRRENGFQMINQTEAGTRYYTSGADYRVELTKG